MPGVEQFRLETWEVDEMVASIERPNPFLLAKFFPTPVFFETKSIEFDIVERGKRLAPFVSPMSEGRAMRSSGSSTRSITPAYIKPKKVVMPGQAFTRMPGEPYGGNLSPRQRLDRAVLEEIAEHRDMIDNRLEWMASKALTTGKVVISGDDYQSVEVDFGHNSGLRTAAGVGVGWDDNNGVPLDDIETIGLAIREKSYGAVADTIVLDGKAWALFRTKMATNVNFSNQVRLGSSAIESGPRNDIDGELVGQLAGRYSIWVYDGAYENESGVTTKYLPDYSMIVAASGAIQGKQYFGAIQDVQSLIATKHFVKTKESFDPSGIEVLSQSAPMVAPKRPNAYAYHDVHTA